MSLDKVPEWVAWLAQDADGVWHPQGAGRGCETAEAATAALWSYEAEPLADCEATLTGPPRRD